MTEHTSTPRLILIGIGSGNPDHLTLQGVKALNSADLILIPRKGQNKTDLAELRHEICTSALSSPVPVAEFDLPSRDVSNPNYQQSVNDWHERIAHIWQDTIKAYPKAHHIALLVWGDPSLYDSTLRIADRLYPKPEIEVIPGITAIQALTAAHSCTLNEIGAPFLVTTGRQLREHGWPDACNTVVVMLDGECSFQSIDPDGVQIWWSAYAGMPQQVTLSGSLAKIGPEIIAARAKARKDHGWIMDVYLLKKS